MVKPVGNVAPAALGGGPRIEPGAYLCRFKSAEDNTFREAAVFEMEVAEGEAQGCGFRLWMNYGSDKDLARTRQRLDAFAASNPGFNPVAAWDAAQWQLFVGRVVGVVFDEEDYTGKDGGVRHGVKAGAVVPVQQLRDGTAPAPRHKGVDGKWCSIAEARAAEQSAEATAAAVAAYDWQGAGDGAAYQQPTQYAPGGYMAQQAAAIPASSIPF